MIYAQKKNLSFPFQEPADILKQIIRDCYSPLRGWRDFVFQNVSWFPKNGMDIELFEVSKQF